MKTRWERIRERREHGAGDHGLSFGELLSHYCPRVFSTPDGQALLSLLANKYVLGPIPAGDSESALREFLGARNLVLDLERATSEGIHASGTDTGESASGQSESSGNAAG